MEWYVTTTPLRIAYMIYIYVHGIDTQLLRIIYVQSMKKM